MEEKDKIKKKGVDFVLRNSKIEHKQSDMKAWSTLNQFFYFHSFLQHSFRGQLTCVDHSAMKS